MTQNIKALDVILGHQSWNMHSEIKVMLSQQICKNPLRFEYTSVAQRTEEVSRNLSNNIELSNMLSFEHCADSTRDTSSNLAICFKRTLINTKKEQTWKLSLVAQTNIKHYRSLYLIVRLSWTLPLTALLLCRQCLTTIPINQEEDTKYFCIKRLNFW